ncbi:MAG: alpha-ketoacid dehydrogenase subunit beta [Firmicutes bacterium]|nr:alpha-ketoacid dehydrogenase subunit beta [Bacillota bacterium]
MREITYAQAVREALAEEMRRDPRVFLLGEDIGVYGGAFGVTLGLVEEFGEDRVMDTPLSEAAIIGAAVGAAVVGMRPVAEVQFSDFLTIGADQLVNQAAKMRYMFGGKAEVPMVVRTPAGSGTGAAAQHSQSLETWFMHIPGLKVVAPATPHDAKGLLKAAIRDNNPVVVFEHKLLYKTKGPVPEDEYTVPIGKAAVRREGRDVTVVATSVMVPRSLQAAERLADEGISAEVIDLRSLRPLDAETVIASVCKTGRAVVVHEANKFAGFGGEIVGTIVESEAFDFLDAPVLRLAGKDVPIPYNPRLEKAAVPQEDDIVEACRRLMRESRRVRVGGMA